MNDIQKMCVVIVGIISGTLLAVVYIYTNANRYNLVSSQSGIAYEIDKSSGNTWLLSGIDKTPHQAEEIPHNNMVKEIPEFEVSKLAGNASLYDGKFSGKIYNGSFWSVSSIVFKVTAKENDGSIRWSRFFIKSLTIKPLTTKLFSIEVVGDNGVTNYQWSIEQAFGINKIEK